LIVLGLAVACPGLAQALVIKPIFDTSITSLKNATQVESAIDAAIGLYETDLKSNVTIEIDFSWGTIDGSAVAKTAAAESLSYIYTGFTYAEVESYIKQAAAANPADTALVQAAANLPAKDPSGLNSYAITEAEAEALGLISPTATGIDGYVGFSSALSYDLDPADGTTAGAYDIEALAQHEISEVMGRMSGISSTKPTYAMPFDLYRYQGVGKPSFGYSTLAYFSINGGKTNLGTFDYGASGDRGDWVYTATTVDAFDEAARTGVDLWLSSADLTALDALGWDTAVNPGGWTTSNATTGHGQSIGGDVPEPASWSLMFVGVGFAGAGMRGRRAARVRRGVIA
jgi:hypothetical protein